MTGISPPPPIAPMMSPPLAASAKTPMRGLDLTIGVLGTLVTPILIAIFGGPFLFGTAFGFWAFLLVYVGGIAGLSVLAYKVKRPGFAVGMMSGAGTVVLLAGGCALIIWTMFR